jgi:hypothetical protein
MASDILMLTGSSKASEVAKEKGSMVDIHLHRLWGGFGKPLGALDEAHHSSGLCAVIIANHQGKLLLDATSSASSTNSRSVLPPLQVMDTA